MIESCFRDEEHMAIRMAHGKLESIHRCVITYHYNEILLREWHYRDI